MSINVKKERRVLPNKAIIGMIHTLPLPGSVGYVDNFDQVLNRAMDDLSIYLKAKVDAVIIENMADVPYAKPPLETVTIDGMLTIAREIRGRADIPVGIQMLEAANCEAMQIAGETKLDFIRAEGFVYAHVGGAGLIEGSARKILKMRKKYSHNIQVFADVKKKHCAHMLTADLTIADTVRQSDFFLCGWHHCYRWIYRRTGKFK